MIKLIFREKPAHRIFSASSTIYLLKNPSGSRAASTLSGTRTYSRHWTPVHLDFVVENIEEAAQHALDAGANRESECIEWNASKCITFSDPFGHGFCLIEFAEETYRKDAVDAVSESFAGDTS